MKIYIETTIPSYLTSRPSRDVILLARQEMSREWWETGRGENDLYLSEYVLSEAGAGNPDAADRRLALPAGIPLLDVTSSVEEVAGAILETGLIPSDAVPDAFHIALAAVHAMDVLPTWNCRHIANPAVLGKANRVVRSYGYEPSLVCTPEEMLGE